MAVDRLINKALDLRSPKCIAAIDAVILKLLDRRSGIEGAALPPSDVLQKLRPMGRRRSGGRRHPSR